MRTCLAAALSALLWSAVFGSPGLSAQALDETMVPRGMLRLQAHPRFSSWHRTFGAASEPVEIGAVLTADNSTALFPGTSSVRSLVRQFGGLPQYDPIAGPTFGRVQQEATTIDFGGEVGILDWLSVGVVVPWARTRTELDVLHLPDTLNGNVGLSPVATDAAAVDAFRASATAATNVSRNEAVAVCSGGPSAACTTAQDLADRTAALAAALEAAYDGSPFFPLVGSAAGTGLSASLAAINTELAAANLSTFLPVVLATDVLAEGGMRLLPTVAGLGIDAAPLATRQGLWSVGDVEASARIRLLDNLGRGEEPPVPGIGYRLVTRLTARLPTGTREDPNVLFDTGTGDRTLDLEGTLAGELRLGGLFALSASAFYARSGATTIDLRVAPSSVAYPAASTLRAVRWQPGLFVGYALAPQLRMGGTIVLHGELRQLHRFRDELELVTADPMLSPAAVAMESGLKLTQVGGGLRYDSVEPWLRGDAPRPMEIHLRFLHTIDGSGGRAPEVTRVEAGIRLFRRLWG